MARAKCLCQRGLADSGNAFNQQVSARENRHQGQADHFILAADYLPQEQLSSCSRAVGQRPSRSRETLVGFYYAELRGSVGCYRRRHVGFSSAVSVRLRLTLRALQALPHLPTVETAASEYSSSSDADYRIIY